MALIACLVMVFMLGGVTAQGDGVPELSSNLQENPTTMNVGEVKEMWNHSVSHLERKQQALTFFTELSPDWGVEFVCVEHIGNDVFGFHQGKLGRKETLTYDYVPRNTDFGGSIRCNFELYDEVAGILIAEKQMVVWEDRDTPGDLCPALVYDVKCTDCTWKITDDYFYLIENFSTLDPCDSW